MARQTFSYTHGDSGTEPASSLDFAANERPNPQHFDWYWDQVTKAISGHAEEFDRLDSDDDGIVDEADDADTVDGYHASDLGSGASDDGTEILATSTDFNFGTGLSVTDDGDGTVTIQGTSQAPVDSVNGQTGDTLVNMNGYDLYITDTEPTGASQGDIWIDNTNAF